ncbi:MAG: NAD(+) diphosphatase [Actinomycetota bacterium]
MILDLLLAHASLDPDAAARTRPGLLDAVLAEASTGVVLVDELGHLALHGTDLDLVPAHVHVPTATTVHVHLGRTADGAARVLAIAPRDKGRDYRDLRRVMADMTPEDRGVAVPAVAIANWHHTHAHCPRCGRPTEVSAAGWVRVCPECGLDHYPRTDPAVIMAVTDDADRLLLAHAAHFPAGRYSMVAGYVEPGESLENAVVRETREEVGLDVVEVAYRGSQPWPFPRSLMAAFTARVAGTPVPRVDGVEITDARFFGRPGLVAAVAAGEVTLPGPASVAQALLEDWFGGHVA